MIDDRIQRTEASVKGAGDLPEQTKAEILELLTQLQAKISQLSETHSDDATSIAQFVEASTHEAIRSTRKPGLLQSALQGLQQSVDGFEASHPEMVVTVNRFATSLANMGL